MKLDAKIPSGPLAQKWDKHRFEEKLINPANKRKFDVIVVGTGLAGASAAATLAELGYNVKAFCYQDSPRRAHSIAAQGGINAAKNYQNDGDSIYRLFYDTIKGGDFRAREANVYRLPVNTAAFSPTARSVALRFPAPFTLAARPASNCSLALTKP
jgi:succinate dehydrogenase / fumarate reductase flavoprotein subunit